MKWSFSHIIITYFKKNIALVNKNKILEVISTWW